MARPRKTIDYEILEELCGIQCTGEECASILKVDYDTLNRILKRDGHGGFTEYFKKHSDSGKASLRRVQFKSALDGSVPMMIWLGKQHLGQKDKSDVAVYTPEDRQFNLNFIGLDQSGKAKQNG